MSLQVVWTPTRQEEFIRLAGLDGIEAEIIRLRCKRYGRTKDIELLREKGFYVSQDTYDKTIKRLKYKYDIVQAESDVLPPRKQKDAYGKEGI